ncbi:hypothetical protein CK203_094377 [Vitis vinifera]|uniref:Uncharacterized protein n=1 Tax=Vitis vinifera TaxID=29760 RepID=A0A438CW88_VITVI|nr:hypothetical protein CK203_094377 [Vitis vinifera]
MEDKCLIAKDVTGVMLLHHCYTCSPMVPWHETEGQLTYIISWIHSQGASSSTPPRPPPTSNA